MQKRNISWLGTYITNLELEQFFYRFIRKVASRVKKNVGGGHVPPKFQFLSDWLDTNRAVVVTVLQQVVCMLILEYVTKYP